MLILCEKLPSMHAGLYGYESRLSTDDLALFIKIEFERIGADTNFTPREVIRDFIELLDIVYQNPQINVSEFIMSEDMPSSLPQESTGDEFAEFEI